MPSNKAIKRKKRRPTRQHTLTRERVFREGLVALDRDGPAALSIRGLAKRLGVSPMALYNHLSSKEDLLHGIAEHVIDKVQYECASNDWREQIRICFRGLRNACLAHPGVVRLVESAEVLPPSIFRPMEITLAALQEAGIESEDGLRAYFLLANFTMGQVSYQIRGPFPGLDAAQAVRHGKLPAATFPASTAALWTTSLHDWDFDAAFEFGLATILTGLANYARNG